MDVIGLMDSKKRCLRRFLEVSESFLAEARKGELWVSKSSRASATL